NKKDAVKQLEHLAKKLGIDDLLGRKYQNLSGGQKRRVDLAKALMHHPQILFLDEPTTGLDPQSRAHVWEAIQTLRQEKGTTIFLTTHYLDEADQADQVAIIDNGTIIAHDTPMNLKATYAKTALYLRLKPEVSEQLLANYRPKRVSDRYYMIMKDCFEAFRVVHELQNVIADFEIKQGTMDEVFIALTGKEIREDGHR
ncbi:MAG: ATP-binding cassette domain-containing protein, partial [Erysipelotrichaceae bacterium]